MKVLFDPKGLLNPGKIVDAPPMEKDLRYGTAYQSQPLKTEFRYREDGSFAAAVELCSGVGHCRKTLTGTMCPSYMVTRDEEHSTRGRANALRLAMTGQLGADAMTSDRMYGTLDLCISCKACKSECPSNVDMAKLKSEFLQQYYASGPRPLSHLLMGQIFRLDPIGFQPWLRWPTRRSEIRCSSGFWKRPPGSTGGGPCRRSSATISGNGSTITWLIPDQAAGRSCCSMTASPRTTTLMLVSRPYRCWKRAVTGWSWPVCAVAAARRSPRGS